MVLLVGLVYPQLLKVRAMERGGKKKKKEETKEEEKEKEVRSKMIGRGKGEKKWTTLVDRSVRPWGQTWINTWDKREEHVWECILYFRGTPIIMCLWKLDTSDTFEDIFISKLTEIKGVIKKKKKKRKTNNE